VFSTVYRVCDETSDALVAPPPDRKSLAETMLLRRAVRQARFCRRLVKEDSIPEPGRLPSTNALSLVALSRTEEPATVLTVLPPRAGFRRSFALVARSPRAHAQGSTQGLDPTLTRLWAKRCSSTSAIKTTREHDRSIV